MNQPEKQYQELAPVTDIPLRHGAFLEQDGTTRFSLWAPDAIKVAVKFTNGQTHQLHPESDGWFSIQLSFGAGTSYNFVINDELEVPDPASRAQVDDIQGLSCVVDHQAYVWKNINWRGRPWHEVVIYELHVGVLGGFAEVEAYLPTLVELGVTAVELMPLNEFPGARNWGYDGVLIFAPDTAYGTPDELKSLIDTAHSLGLMIFVDVVYNHFGPEGNYLGHYAKGFFRDDIKTPWGPAIDFRQRAVRSFYCENAFMWILDYQVDGLRLDAVHAISEKDFLVELAQTLRTAVAPDRQIHLVLENEDNNAFLLENGFNAQWNDDGHNVLHTLLTGENEGYYADFCESATSKLARYLSEGFIYQGERSPRGRLRGEPSAHLPPTSFVVFLQNHDQVGNRAFGERLRQLTDKDSLKAAVVLLLLSPMVPLLFMGEEWGSQQPFLYFTDHPSELAKLVRDGRRGEFADFSIFANPETREQIPDPNALATFTDSMLDYPVPENEDHAEWRQLYQQLLKLRHSDIMTRLPGTKSLGARVLADRAVIASWEMGDKSVLRIALNFSNETIHTATEALAGEFLFGAGIILTDQQQGCLPSLSALVTLTKQG